MIGETELDCGLICQAYMRANYQQITTRGSHTQVDNQSKRGEYHEEQDKYEEGVSSTHGKRGHQSRNFGRELITNILWNEEEWTRIGRKIAVTIL